MARPTKAMLAILACLCAAVIAGDRTVLRAQIPGLPSAVPADAGPFGALRWRNIGPDRGGRSIAVAGSSSRPLEYYFGATGGGLWKTVDGGISWKAITDGQLTSSSVGAIAVAPSNPDIVYIGMGESELRGNIAQGDGVYKSADGGKKWEHVGLDDTQVV